MANDILAKLKIITNSLFNENIQVSNHISNKEFHSYFIYKLMNYIQSSPKLCWYFNKYLNNFNLYKYDCDEIVNTFRYMLKSNGIRNKNDLYFSKRIELEINEFFNKVKSIFDDREFDYNYHDLTSLYILYKYKCISDEDIDNMLEDNSKNTKSKTKSVKSNVSYNNKLVGQKIMEIRDQFLNYINKNTRCNTCPLGRKSPVILDTNMEQPGQTDIIFMGLNPGDEEAKVGLPFVGRSGKLFREYLDTLLKEFKKDNKYVKYMITNMILCSTSNENDIPKINIVANNCKPLVTQLLKLFPTKLLVIFGGKVLKYFFDQNVTNATKLNGKFIRDGILFSVHPSYVIRNYDKNIELFDNTFEQIYKYLDNKIEVENNTISNNIENNEIFMTSDMTLFDIKQDKNKAIYIMCDGQGKKHYITKDISIPIYIKRGNYMDCDYIETSVDEKWDINFSQRQMIMSSISSQLS
jgi:DNA polymerase